ncbi:MAG: hypothetical protein ACI97A_000489, partial [Planctomycetota bacterium]
LGACLADFILEHSMRPQRLRTFATSMVVLALTSSFAMAQFTLYDNINGALPDRQFGRSVSDAGDVNGDGFDDFLVGDFGAFPAIGAARILSGVDGSVIRAFTGTAAQDEFGAALAGAGDVNGDGIPDVIIGIPGADSNGSNAGSAQVFSGADGSLLHSWNGGGPNASFGDAVDGLGDVNGDGFDDVIVGAPRTQLGGGPGAPIFGSAQVFSGIDGSMLFSFLGAANGSFLGAAVSTAGDINADGIKDFLIGSPGTPMGGGVVGIAEVYSGADGSLLRTHLGGSPFFAFGASVDGANDVNRDGFDDVIVGSPRENPNGPRSGSVRVFSGIDGTLLHRFDGDSADDEFGFSVSGLGDANGDGFADILVGAPFDSNNAIQGGRAFVFSGRNGNTMVTAATLGAGDALGFSVSGAGDVNGDGFKDIVVGVPGRDVGNPSLPGFAPNAGRVRVFAATTRPILHYTSEGDFPKLRLDWTPDGGPFSLTGSLTCSGASPGAFGIAGVSLAPADLSIFGFPLLIAVDPLNLIFSMNFGFDILGELQVPNLSRQEPGIAGALLYLQFYETFPSPASSNGVRMLVAP